MLRTTLREDRPAFDSNFSLRRKRWTRHKLTSYGAERERRSPEKWSPLKQTKKPFMKTQTFENENDVSFEVPQAYTRKKEVRVLLSGVEPKIFSRYEHSDSFFPSLPVSH